jgi:LCP family protein required for cell wall assembly
MPSSVKPNRSTRHADPRSAAAAALSFVFPGGGQAYNGQWALAWLLAAPVLLLVAFVILVASVGGAGMLGRLLDARVLIALIVLDLALLGWRLVAIVQAHSARSSLRRAGWPVWATAVLVLVTVFMHALPAYYAAKAIDTIGAVAFEGGGQLFDDADDDTTDIEVSRPTFEPEVSRGERVTVLLVGIDYAPGRTTHLTDTMLVATFDAITGDGALISVPRDLYGVPLGDGREWNAKLNSLMVSAAADPQSFPLGGPGTLKAAIGELLGTRIHYFAAIDLLGLRQVIDTVGGVDITVERAVSDPAFDDPFGVIQGGFYIDAGTHHLNGATALAYVRSRMGIGDSDFTRAARQQQVLTAIADKLTAGNILVTLPGLLDAVRDNVATDIPEARISELAVAGQKVELGGLERVVLEPPTYVTPEPDSAAGYILHPHLDAIRELGESIFGP